MESMLMSMLCVPVPEAEPEPVLCSRKTEINSALPVLYQSRGMRRAKGPEGCVGVWIKAEERE